MKLFKTYLNSELTALFSYDHIFKIKGTMHVSCYINTDKTSTIADVVALFNKDIDLQFEYRLETLKEESDANSNNYNKKLIYLSLFSFVG